MEVELALDLSNVSHLGIDLFNGGIMARIESEASIIFFFELAFVHKGLLQCLSRGRYRQLLIKM
jgi:hypothetical protein